MMKLLAPASAIAIVTTTALAESLPVAKPPNGTCSWGWISSGNYCLRNGSR